MSSLKAKRALRPDKLALRPNTVWTQFGLDAKLGFEMILASSLAGVKLRIQGQGVDA